MTALPRRPAGIAWRRLPLLLPGLLALVACTVSSVPLRRALIVLGSVMVAAVVLQAQPIGLDWL